MKRYYNVAADNEHHDIYARATTTTSSALCAAHNHRRHHCHTFARTHFVLNVHHYCIYHVLWWLWVCASNINNARNTFGYNMYIFIVHHYILCPTKHYMYRAVGRACLRHGDGVGLFLLLLLLRLSLSPTLSLSSSSFYCFVALLYCFVFFLASAITMRACSCVFTGRSNDEGRRVASLSFCRRRNRKGLTIIPEMRYRWQLLLSNHIVYCTNDTTPQHK